MLLRTLIVTFGAVLLSAGQSLGQAVQLPTFRFFTVNTTVSVPDRGSVGMGGVNRSSIGRTSRGVPIAGRLPGVGRAFGNTAIGRSTSASNVRVSATIIDLDAMDRALLGDAAHRRSAPAASPAQQRADYLTRNVARGNSMRSTDASRRRDSAAGSSVVQIRRRNQAAAAQRDAEAQRFFDKAQSAEAEGKTSVAKIYYRMAARRADGAFKTTIAARLEALSAESTNVATGRR